MKIDRGQILFREYVSTGTESETESKVEPSNQWLKYVIAIQMDTCIKSLTTELNDL